MHTSENSEPPLAGRKLVILYTNPDVLEGEELKEITDSVKLMKKEIEDLGVKPVFVPVVDSIEEAVKDFDPQNTIIFNWCEQFKDIPNSFQMIPPPLDKLGFIYTGSDAFHLELTQDKAKTKEVLIKNGVSTPVSKVYAKGGVILNGWNIFPAFVKPVYEHSSYGITTESIIDNLEQLKKQVERITGRTYSCGALVEDFIDGPEYNVAIWGNNSYEVLPISAIDYSVFKDYHDRLCNYDAKWVPGSKHYQNINPVCPPNIDSELKKAIETEALKAYKALGCRDYGRIDIRVRNRIPYVLDVNTNPDVSVEGGFMRSARTADYHYGATILKICEIALERAV